MPKNKDLKRLVRERMHKTGESYTTARANLIRKDDSTAERATPVDYASLAGVSDAAVEAKTGCGWELWVRALDYAKATSMSHREIARYVQETWQIPGWWAQTVAVGYERIKGLREIGQRRDGSYDANKSRTFAVPLGVLYAAFEDPKRRAAWLDDAETTIRTATPDKSMRFTWRDGSAVDAYFTAKTEQKSSVALQHRKLPSAETAAAMKTFWHERLDALATLLSDETH